MKDNYAALPEWEFNIHVRRTQESRRTTFEAKTLFIYSLTHTHRHTSLYNFPPGILNSFIERVHLLVFELFLNKINVKK